MLALATYLRHERFHFDRPHFQPGLNWPLIIALVPFFGIWAIALVIAWRFFHA